MSRITHDNVDKWLFNFHEGNLSSKEKKELDQFLKENPEYQEESDTWKIAHISEPLAPYAFEAELHAIASTSTIYTYRRWAAAAGLLLLLGASAFYIFFSNDENETSQNISASLQNKNLLNDNSSTLSKGNLNSVNSNQSISENNSNAEISSNGNKNELTEASVENKNTSGMDQNKNSIAFNSQKNGNNLEVNDKMNRKNRQQVSIDIKNEVKIKTEKSFEMISENNELVNENQISIEEADKQFAIASAEKAKLKLKENQNSHVISENKNRDTKRRKSDRYKLDPNPSFTNLRDPNLLMTNNQLVDQYGGFAGGMISSRYSLNYRNSWTGKKEINSQNMLFSYDQLIRKLKTGIAFSAFYNDYSAGMFTTMGASLTISPKFKLGRGTSIEPSVTFSYAQKNVNQGRTVVGSFIEDRRGNVMQLYRNGMVPTVSTAYMPDMKIGAVFQNKKFWAATSIEHLLTPKEVLYSTESNINRNEIEFKATIGTDYLHRPESGNVVSPQMSIYHHDGYTEMWLGAQARFKQVTVGASFSQFQDYLATVGFQTPAFKMFYQFDKTRSLLLNEKIGSHEIGVRFALNGNNRGSKSILNNER